MNVMGVDPGPTTGIAVAHDWGVSTLIQCNADSVPAIVTALFDAYPIYHVAIEEFVSGRHSRGRAARVTRDVVQQVCVLGAMGAVHRRPAARVKPWSTDDRLTAWDAHAIERTRGMPHARDAIRHALFCLVADLGAPDPFSRKVASHD